MKKMEKTGGWVPSLLSEWVNARWLALVPFPFQHTLHWGSQCLPGDSGRQENSSFGNAFFLMDLLPWLVPSPSPSVLLPNRHHICYFCDSSVINSGL